MLVLFDGPCNLCNRVVRFVIRHDRKKRFRFCALQSPYGLQQLNSVGLPQPWNGSLVLIYKGRVWLKSDAVIEIARRLDGVWPLLGLFRFVPRGIRDAVYDWIAGSRYRWFGQSANCALPGERFADRFIQG
jgi:predicted DCC family thiol-disulfide oxidoreductase YuxK